MELFTKFFSWLLKFLPTSPFQSFISAIPNIPYLAELNWFFPVSECLAVMQLWLTVVALYYLYSVIMRFIGLIA